MSDVERAREILERERESVLTGLREARAEARAAAARQREWRTRVEALLDRGKASGVSVVEMARALGVSRQWATRLLDVRERQARLRRLAGEARTRSTRRSDDD